MLPDQLLIAAAREVGPSPLVADYLEALKRVLGRVRAAAGGGVVNVPALVGMGKISLDEGVKVCFEGGEIRNPTKGDLKNLADAENVTAVLEHDVPLQLLIIREANAGTADLTEAMGNQGARFEKHEKDMRRAVDLVRLALLLASQADRYIAPVELASTVLVPLAGASVGLSAYRYPVSPFGSVSISSDMADCIESWVPRVARHPENLDMSMRRLLAATSARHDAMDSFVDAVICWENMFGTGEGEVSFRVAGAIAHLLVPGDEQERLLLFDELKRLYRARSSLVHGAKEPSPAKAHSYMARSIEVAIQAFKEIYVRPELLDAKDSSIRGRKLLLGA